MKTTFVISAICLATASVTFAQSKENERLANSATVLQQVLPQIPTSVLDKAVCVVVFPSVKKVAIGIGGSYGRGDMTCRKGANMDGSWGNPVMYSIDQGSLGIQLGSEATDFVLVAMNQKAANELMTGKLKLGTSASVAAGPGARTGAYTGTDDILTYSQSKGVFAGVSLAGATVEPDNDANKSLYGKSIGATQIATGNVPTVPSAQGLISILDNASPVRK